MPDVNVFRARCKRVRAPPDLSQGMEGGERGKEADVI